MRVLVTGGAGYLGSHAVVSLIAAGHEPVILDNFCNSKPAVLSRLEQITGTRIRVFAFDLRDEDRLNAMFRDSQIDAVLHFAGLKAVGESMIAPLTYYHSNIGSTVALLSAMEQAGVRRLVFSSSATVYGLGGNVALREEAPIVPTNPYGRTKSVIEDILRDLGNADRRWRISLLRYFNPVGAHTSGLIGEDPLGVPTNLLPLVSQVAAGRRRMLEIYGGDYPTPDGTCGRDYVHVEDLADGHLAALAALDRQGPGARAFNLGTGRAHSVLQIVRAFERASGRGVPYKIVGRRGGDAMISYADPSRASAELGWRAVRDLDDMCADMWRWQCANPLGYTTELAPTPA
jgi:UDP-glucose 4-epimerase